MDSLERIEGGASPHTVVACRSSLRSDDSVPNSEITAPTSGAESETEDGVESPLLPDFLRFEQDAKLRCWR